MVGDNNNSFAKTICSICFEDLKPIVEDLQSISVCGHVFHELCLQQWFEYCPNGKKRTCPVCKQSCTNSNVGRLYFQSVGDPNDSSISQKPRDYVESPEEMQKEIIRLEGKVVALGSTLEKQQEELKQVKDQLITCKEELKVEGALKNEALTQKTAAQQLLRMKSEALDKSTLDCMRVQERNLTLAKELAALKLASDLNLDDDEVMKLASLGNDGSSKETVDVLRRSLIIRNRSYKELMTKCNILGRGEARCLHKLEKANEKIKKLKLRVQELETAVEMKDNEALRVLNASNGNMKLGPANQVDFDKTSDIQKSSFSSRKAKPPKPTSPADVSKPRIIYGECNQGEGLLFRNDEGNFRSASTSHELLTARPVEENGESFSQNAREGIKSDKPNKPLADEDDDLICYGAVKQVQTSLHIRKEARSPAPFAQPGDNCFSGGLLGPDGTNWHLGKWCKKGSAVAAGLQRSNVRSGDLIAVGADGRGGRIKVMRTLDQLPTDDKENPAWAKRCKLGTKTSKTQPQGCLQIEHFFQKQEH